MHYCIFTKIHQKMQYTIPQCIQHFSPSLIVLFYLEKQNHIGIFEMFIFAYSKLLHNIYKNIYKKSSNQYSILTHSLHF